MGRIARFKRNERQIAGEDTDVQQRNFEESKYL